VTIDHDGETPVYRQLAELLRSQIESGKIAAGRSLPSIKSLAQEHGIARGSVERAVKVLKDAGLIRTSIGRGLYVVPESERSQT
jgi:GntR family transcriptional regulator